MSLPRLYIDTSVFGGCFDTEFSHDSNRLVDAAANVLHNLRSNEIIELIDDGIYLLKVKNLPGKKVGPEQLIKGYIWKYFGARPAILDKNTVEKILNARLEKYDIDSHVVKSALDTLEDVGIVRVIGKED